MLGALQRWAAGWPQRVWAIEGAAGLGRLLAQQLVASGETVVDVPSALAARARVLQRGVPSPKRRCRSFSLQLAARSVISATGRRAAPTAWRAASAPAIRTKRRG